MEELYIISLLITLAFGGIQAFDSLLNILEKLSRKRKN